MADTSEQQTNVLDPCGEYDETEKIANKNTPGRQKLWSWLNKNFRIRMTDGRILIGLFLCTDSDANIILGMCSEFRDEEERNLGLVIVPKKHITSIEVDTSGDTYANF